MALCLRVGIARAAREQIQIQSGGDRFGIGSVFSALKLPSRQQVLDPAQGQKAEMRILSPPSGILSCSEDKQSMA